MSPHVVELLPDHLDGVLDAAAAAEVNAHVAACDACAAALAGFAEIEALLALSLDSQAPDPSVRARLLAGFASERLHRFSGQVAAMFALTNAQARAALDTLDDATAWEVSSMPGVFQHLLPNAPANCLMGFIRVPSGVSVPWHEHLGNEQTLVLQGVLRDSDGRKYVPGQEMPKHPGTTHTFMAEGGVDLMCGVIIENGWTLL